VGLSLAVSAHAFGWGHGFVAEAWSTSAYFRERDRLWIRAGGSRSAKAEWEAKMIAAIQKLVRANPRLFYETPDGKIGAVAESNVIPLR
jgi:hypothetical protein